MYKTETDTCEWCGMSYPRGGWQYYDIQVFDQYHKICKDCYDHLTPKIKLYDNKIFGNTPLISGKTQELLNVFDCQHIPCGGGLTITVTSSGIGRHVVVTCDECHKTEDISDYDSW